MKYLSVIFLSMLLAGCTIRVKEETFFRPQQADNYAAYWSHVDEDGDTLKGELARQAIFKQLGLVKHTGSLIAPTGTVQLTHFKQDEATKPLILYCGGSSFDVTQHGDKIAYMLQSFGDALIWNYPGTGTSEGRPTGDNVRAAGAAVLSALMDYRRPNQDVVFWGYSLGGFVCADMTDGSDLVQGLILEATAPSTGEGVAAYSSQIAGGLIKLSLSDKAKNVDISETLRDAPFPTLVMSAGKDTIFPVELSQTLVSRLTANGSDVTYIEYENATHYSIPIQSNFVKDVSAFLDDAMSNN